jgi:predicted  nucleic acid-binding Zn-ribbon protein
VAEPFDTLLKVQDLDTAIDQLRRRKETLPAREALTTALAERAALEADVAELRGQVADLAGRQAAIEEQIAQTAARRHTLEARMESGAVSDPRDLQAVDHEVHHLADRQSQFEDAELELVAEQEPLDDALATNTATTAALDARAEELRAEIAEAEKVIDAEVVSAGTERAELAAGLPEELSARYEALRTKLGGVGAARLVGDHCDGCHLTLPSVEVDRIRHLPADRFATCDQCGRILVH